MGCNSDKGVTKRDERYGRDGRDEEANPLIISIHTKFTLTRYIIEENKNISESLTRVENR